MTLLEKLQDMRNLRNNLTHEEQETIYNFWKKETGIHDRRNCGSCLRKWARFYRNNHGKDKQHEQHEEEKEEDVKEFNKETATKVEIMEFLKENNIEFTTRMSKEELLNLIENGKEKEETEKYTESN